MGQVTMDVGSAIENFVKVYKCDPADEAAKKLEQILEGVMAGGSPVSTSAAALPTVASLEAKYEAEQRVQIVADLNQKLLKRVQEGQNKLESMKKEREGLVGEVRHLEKELQKVERERGDLLEANQELAGALKKAEGELGDERTQREMHESTVEGVKEKIGVKNEKKFWARIEDLLEKEKEMLKHKGKKK